MDYIAFQYADALFQLSMDDEKVEEVLEEFNGLLTSVDSEFYMFMDHPNLKNKQKQALIDSIVHTTLLKHLCYVLIDNHRMSLLPDVLEEYQALINKENKLMNVDVFSKKPLTDKEKKNLIASLEKRFSNKVELNNIVDEKIIGGVRLEYNGAILDDTVNHYFKALQTRLTK